MVLKDDKVKLKKITIHSSWINTKFKTEERVCINNFMNNNAEVKEILRQRNDIDDTYSK